MRRRILAALTLTLALVYWGLGLPFSLLYLNFAPEQTRWVLFPYLWEVPLLGLLIVLYPTYRWLEPVVPNQLERDPETARERALQLPLRLPISILAGSVFGYLVGSVQLRFLGQMPWEEVLKNAAFGVPTGLLYGLLAYFIVSYHLRPALEQCERLAPCPDDRTYRIKLVWKTWTCLVVLGVMAVSVMGLMAYSTSQRLAESTLSDALLRQLDTFAMQVQSGEAWTSLLDFGPLDQLGVVTAQGELTYYRGPEGGEPALREQLAGISSSRGSRILRFESNRILAWRQLPGGSRILVLAPVDAQALRLHDALRHTLLVGFATVVVASILAWALALSLVQPITSLTLLAARVPQGWPVPPPEGSNDGIPENVPAYHTDDEIGSLGKAFQRMLQQLAQAQQDLVTANRRLENLVEKRTRRVQELGSLYEVSKSLSSSLDVDCLSNEVLSKVTGILGADACSLMLVDRGHLHLKAAHGLEPSTHKSPVAIGVGFLGTTALNGATRSTIQDQDPGFPRELSERGLKTLVSAPMSLRASTIGLVNLYFREPRALSQDQLHLLSTVAGQVAVALDNARLYEEKDRVSELLRRMLIPQEDFLIPSIRVGQRYQPSRVLSGDYYEIIPIDANRLAVVMADVAGKGAEAALDALRLKHAMQLLSGAATPPARALERLNAMVYGSGAEARVVTAFYGIVDLEQRELLYASAGHEPAILQRNGVVEELPGTGLLLGAVEDCQCGERRVELPAGSGLLLYTDGVSEARCADGEFFGAERIHQLVERWNGEDPASLVDRIHVEAVAFTGGNFLDDLSLLAMVFP